MAYADDARTVRALEKARIAALIIAAVLLALDLATDLPLAWPRAITWSVVGLLTIKEGRVVKRLGRSPDAYYLRAILYFVVAVVCII
jgi:hypothetical protein